MQFHDYYKDLGVEPGAPAEEIKKAYRRLARKYHPDVSKEADAEARFKAINEAYEVLRDKDRRAAYDNLRQQGHYREGQSFRPPPDWDGGGFAFDGDEPPGDFSDFFESLFGRRGFRAGGAGAAPRRPRPLRATIQLPLEQIYHGGPQRIALNGRSYDVRIPAGVTAGQTIRLAGQGPDGGDVLLEVAIAPHPRFEVDGRDVIGRLAITPWQAALGAKVQADTLGGTVTLNVPAGSQPGRRLRLKGRGLPGEPLGDHYVVLDLRVPPAGTDAQQAAWHHLAASYGDDRSEA